MQEFINFNLSFPTKSLPPSLIDKKRSYSHVPKNMRKKMNPPPTIETLIKYQNLSNQTPSDKIKLLKLVNYLHAHTHM